MSTHGCFATFFPPYPIVATRWRSPGVRRRHWRLLLPGGCLLLREDRWWLGVVRRLPGRRPCLFDHCCFCASLLKANLFNLCLYSDIVASADSSMIEHLYSSPRGTWLVLWCLYDLFYFRVVLWYLPVSPWSWLYTFACMISVRLNHSRYSSRCKIINRIEEKSESQSIGRGIKDPTTTQWRRGPVSHTAKLVKTVFGF